MWARNGDWLSAAAVTGTTSLLVSPISRAHHSVWVVPALFVLVRNGSRIPALCGSLLFLLALPWWTGHDGGPSEYGFHGLLTVVSNGYLVAGIAFLVHMTVRLRGIRRGVRSRSGNAAPPDLNAVDDAGSVTA
ncbi:MAG TPA: hypothetical protein VGP70_11315 [Actinomadura sp.]|nr:hypothetical protein [Actinomadura sp.]